MQVGKTKDQGLYNKPSAAVHQGALAAGTLPQYNTIQCSLHSGDHAMELVASGRANGQDDRNDSTAHAPPSFLFPFQKHPKRLKLRRYF